jgi:hypothetical protein
LQHGNLLLVDNKDGRLGVRLIDYDGIHVPELAAVPPGEAGHANYQHPQRVREGTYNAEVDRFSSLVIYTALRGLAAAGRPLWERYDNGDNLLFRESDFAAPGSSPLFRELLTSQEADVAALAGYLLLAARRDQKQTPLLQSIVNADDAVAPLSGDEQSEVDSIVAQGGPARAVPTLASSPASSLDELWRMVAAAQQASPSPPAAGSPLPPGHSMGVQPGWMSAGHAPYLPAPGSGTPSAARIWLMVLVVSFLLVLCGVSGAVGLVLSGFSPFSTASNENTAGPLGVPPGTVMPGDNQALIRPPQSRQSQIPTPAPPGSHEQRNPPPPAQPQNARATTGLSPEAPAPHSLSPEEVYEKFGAPTSPDAGLPGLPPSISEREALLARRYPAGPARDAHEALMMRLGHPPDKLPSPDARQLAGAEADIALSYGDGPVLTASSALVDRLLVAAIDARSDPAARYALYLKAAQLAAALGDVEVAEWAIGRLEDDFAVNGAALRIDMLRAVSLAAVSPQLRQRTAEIALRASGQALATDCYAEADELLAIAETAARQAMDEALGNRVDERRALGDEVRRAAAAYYKAADSLAAGAIEPNVNLAYGKYLCLYKSDWARGLPALEQGSDPLLRAAAAMEAAGNNGPKAIEKADTWWEASRDETGVARRSLLHRACDWYYRALPDLSGDQLASAIQRLHAAIEELPELRRNARGGSPLFSAVAGVWEVSYEIANAKRRYAVTTQGEVFLAHSNTQLRHGWLVPQQGGWLLVFDIDEPGRERWAIANGQLSVEHYNPLDTLKCRAIGKFWQLPELRGGQPLADVDEFASLEGLWVVRFENAVRQLFVIGPKGSLLFVGPEEWAMQEGLLRRMDGRLFWHLNDAARMRFTWREEPLHRIEFFVAKDYPRGPAVPGQLERIDWR